MPLLRAAWEQQLQHLPLQEVPNHVRGTDTDWPVQVWEQNWTGPKGHPFSTDVRQMLIWDQRGWRDGGEGRCFHQQRLKNVEEKGSQFCEAKRSSKTPKIMHYCSFYWNSLTLAAVTGRLPEIICIKTTSVKSASSYTATSRTRVQSSRLQKIINYLDTSCVWLPFPCRRSGAKSENATRIDRL